MLGLIQDQIHQRLPRLFVHFGEDVGRDLDQVGGQLALVPLGEHVVQLRGRKAQRAVQQVVGLGDELHVGVFDAVVHHLDVVPGAPRADVGDAGLTLHLGGDGLEDGAHVFPGLPLAAGHHGGTPQRPVLPAADACAQVVNALRL